MLYNNVLEAIGNTPVIRLNKLNSNKEVDLFIKLEKTNPGGSTKDRPALEMIEDAQKKGTLTKDKIILEATSGNTGIGLAMVAAVKGYTVYLTLSEKASSERKKLLEYLGANLIYSPKEEGTDGAIRLANEIYKKNPQKFFMPNQYDNPANPAAHQKKTAREIIKDLPDLTHLVIGLGTSGTLTGISMALKKVRPEIRIIAVEPASGEEIPGLKNMEESIRPKIFDEKYFDDEISVYLEQAKKTTKDAMSQEGLMIGISSGAALWGALKIAEKIKKGRVLCIAPDGVERYLSVL